MVKPCYLSSQPCLKQVCIFAEIMENARQRSFILPGCPFCKTGCKSSDIGQMFFSWMCLALFISAMGKINRLYVSPLFKIKISRTIFY